MFKSSPEGAGCRYPDKAWPPKSDVLWDILMGKLGNGKHLFLEAYKYKENNYSHDLYHNNHVIQKQKQNKTNKKQKQKQTKNKTNKKQNKTKTKTNKKKTCIKFNPATLFYLHNFSR